MNESGGRVVKGCMETTLIQDALDSNRSSVFKVGRHKLRLHVSTARNQVRYILRWKDASGKKSRFESTNKDSVRGRVEAVVANLRVGQSLALETVNHEKVQALVEANSAIPGVSLDELVRFYKEHKVTSTATVEDVAEAYMASLEKGGCGLRHRDTVKSHLKKFKAAFQTTIGAIQVSELDTYLSLIENRKSRLNHRITISALFRFAQRKNFLPVGLTEAEKTERPQIDSPEPDILSVGEMRVMLEFCDDRKLAVFLLLGGFAGIRSTEIQRMKWSDIHDDYITLGANITKTNRRRIAEVPENLAEWLALFRPAEDGPVSYTEARDHYLYRRVRRLSLKSGIPWRPNALRHTFVSCHLELHRDPPRTCKTTGHSLAVLERHYLKLVSPDAAGQWFNLRPSNTSTPRLSNLSEEQPNPNKRRRHAQPTKRAQDSHNIRRA